MRGIRADPPHLTHKYFLAEVIVGEFQALGKESVVKRKDDKVPPGYKVIYRPYITIKGKLVHASQYGLRAFRLVVPV